MAKKLKEILSSMSQEQFDAEWKEIESLGLEGPSAFEILDYYAVFQQSYINYQLTNDDLTVSEIDYSLAA